MRWIVDSSVDIAVNKDHMLARSEYIRNVTGSEVSAWNYLQVNGQILREFLYCTSDDKVDGTFITAHIGGVYKLCSLPDVYISEFVVANTCIWENMSDKELLLRMMAVNQKIDLYFAKQEMSVDSRLVFRQSTTLSNIGQFGFQTSLSERELFLKRSKGLMEAIRYSFVRVSPIILAGD